MRSALVWLIVCAGCKTKPPPASATATLLSSAGISTCVVLDDHSADCWGANDFGQLGNGVADNKIVGPALVNGLTGAVSIGVGRSFGCALTSGGQVLCWGSNINGRLGDGSATPHYAAQTILSSSSAPFAGATALSVSSDHSCVINNAGDVFCWGSNNEGQIGDNTTTDRNLATQVTKSLGFVSVAAGNKFTCALRSNGDVWCWGRNSNGQLGNGNNTTWSLVPTQSLVKNAAAISAGATHACARLNDGTVQCWGDNTTQQLGSADAHGVYDPSCGQRSAGLCRAVDGLTGVKAVSAGAGFSCAIAAGAKVYCWGNDQVGQLGGNAVTLSPFTVKRSAPELAAAAVAVSAGDAIGCALTNDGGVSCWGRNLEGEAGGSATYYPAAKPNGVALSGGHKALLP